MLNILSLKINDICKIPELEGVLDINSCEFQLLGIFEGGMGITLKLQHLETSELYALKFPQLSSTREYLQSQFVNEMQNVIKLSECSFIAECLNSCSIDKTLCIVSPWYLGGDLFHFVNDLPLSLKMQNIIRIVYALKWAWDELGIVHRDIKPSNILLDKNGLAYLSDFGISSVVNSHYKAHKSKDAQIETFAGTYIYSAPENFFEGFLPSIQADMYSLGCLFYEMETGRPPFYAKNIEQLVAMHVYERHLSPSTNSSIAAIIDKLLEKNPTNRYSSYDALLKDLVALNGILGLPCETNSLPQKRYARAYENICDQGIEAQLLRISNLIDSHQYEVAYKKLKLIEPKSFIPSENDIWGLNHQIIQGIAIAANNMTPQNFEAIEIYWKLNVVKNKPVSFYVNFSECALFQKDFNLAKIICDTALSNAPDDMDLLYNRASASQALGEYNDSWTYIRRILDQRRDPYVLRMAGDCAYNFAKQEVVLEKKLSYYESAFSFYAESYQTNPLNQELAFSLLNIFAEFCDENAILIIKTRIIDSLGIDASTNVEIRISEMKASADFLKMQSFYSELKKTFIRNGAKVFIDCQNSSNLL